MTAAGITTAHRAGRAASYVWLNTRGAVVAVLIALVLQVRAEAVGIVSAPRWHVLLVRVAAGLAGKRATRTAALLAVMAGLVFWSGATWLGVALTVPVAAWVVVRRWWALYPRSTAGRVRAFTTDSFGVPVRSYADHDGYADHWELRRNLSVDATRKVAVVARPSLTAGLPAVPGASCGRGAVAEGRARKALAVNRIPAVETGTLLGPSAVGPTLATDCYAAHRDVIGIYGPPQTGKGAWFGGRIIDHVGAIVATSTKLDLYLATALLRGSAGRRVWLFNPDGLGGLPSDLAWDPLEGCGDAKVARTRAGHLTGGTANTGGKSSGENAELFDGWARGVLASLLMTAARSGRNMGDVAHWVFTQDKGAEVAVKLLVEAFEGKPPQLVVDAMRQITTTEAKKTRDSIFMILREAIEFMADDTVAASCTPTAGQARLDVAAFITNRDSLYIVADKTSVSAPLRAALLGHLFETAKTLSATYPMERLDPPLGMALDEIALNPVPLPEWLPDAGGRGIHLWWAVQSPSQLDTTWGTQPAKVIRDCTNVLMVYGGLKDHDDLKHISDLCGHRHEMTPDPDGPGPGHARYERVPVITPDAVRRLVELHPLVVQRNSRPTIVKVDPYWERADVKAVGPVVKTSTWATTEERDATVVQFPSLEKAS